MPLFAGAQPTMSEIQGWENQKLNMYGPPGSPMREQARQELEGMALKNPSMRYLGPNGMPRNPTDEERKLYAMHAGEENLRNAGIDLMNDTNFAKQMAANMLLGFRGFQGSSGGFGFGGGHGGRGGEDQRDVRIGSKYGGFAPAALTSVAGQNFGKPMDRGGFGAWSKDLGRNLNFNDIKGFAAGGVADAGEPALVGENGPELIFPTGSTTVVPLDNTDDEELLKRGRMMAEQIQSRGFAAQPEPQQQQKRGWQDAQDPLARFEKYRNPAAEDYDAAMTMYRNPSYLAQQRAVQAAAQNQRDFDWAKFQATQQGINARKSADIEAKIKIAQQRMDFDGIKELQKQKDRLFDDSSAKESAVAEFNVLARHHNISKEDSAALQAAAQNDRISGKSFAALVKDLKDSYTKSEDKAAKSEINMRDVPGTDISVMQTGTGKVIGGQYKHLPTRGINLPFVGDPMQTGIPTVLSGGYEKYQEPKPPKTNKIPAGAQGRISKMLELTGDDDAAAERSYYAVHKATPVSDKEKDEARKLRDHNNAMLEEQIRMMQDMGYEVPESLAARVSNPSGGQGMSDKMRAAAGR